VPGAAWDYKIGSFQVLRKWLVAVKSAPSAKVGPDPVRLLHFPAALFLGRLVGRRPNGASDISAHLFTAYMPT